MDILEQLVRSFARRTTQNGQVVLITNNHPALIDAFKALGWSDPYPDPLLLPPVDAAPVFTKATIEPSERTVMPAPEGRRGGL